MKKISPEHKHDKTAVPCYKTVSNNLILGNPKKDPHWKTPRVSPIIGRSRHDKQRLEEYNKTLEKD